MTETPTPDIPITDVPGTGEGDEPDELTPTRFAMERGLLVLGDRTELVLVRHAQQRRSLAEAYAPGGPRLSEFGRRQATMTGRLLAPESGPPVTAVYCSDLNRTRETAQLICTELGGQLEPTPDAALREIDMYSRDLGGADVSAAVQAKAGTEFSRTLRWDAFPNTEASEAFRLRVKGALERIALKHTNEKVVVVSHAGAICAAVAAMIGAEPDMFFFAGHASVSRVFHGDDRLVTHSLNEVAHLRAEGALSF